MVELLRPDVYVQELPGEPTVPNVPTSTAGFIGVAERGPLSSPVLVTSYLDFVKNFGSFYLGNYLAYSVRMFFSEGGSRAWIVRIAGSGAAKATVNVPGFNATNTLKVDAFSEGAWGNAEKVEFIKFQTKVKTEIAAGATVGSPIAVTTAVLDTVVGLEIGDYLRFVAGPSDNMDVLVVAINTSTNTITYDSVSRTAPIPVGSVVWTPSMHRAYSKLAADTTAASITQVNVLDGRNFRVGQLVTFGDLNDAVSVILTGVEGNTLKFASTAFPVLVAANSFVVSQEFKVKIYDKGLLQEVFDYMSLTSANSRDFIENNLKGNSNLSAFVEISDLGSGDLLVNIPAPGTYSLSGGADGATPVDGDFIGIQSSKTGIYAFDLAEDINFMSVPGITSVAVMSALIAFVETGSEKHAGQSVAILDMPLATTSVAAALNFKNVTLNKDTSYAALYMPWLKTIDPENTSQTLLLPPSAFAAGIWSRVAVNRGLEKAPANELILNAFGLAVNITNREHDLLNIANINVIRSEPGQGIKIMGARTLQSLQDGKHYINIRRILNFVKVSLARALRFALFEPNDERLREKVNNVAEQFMKTIHQSGMLQPRFDERKAFFVKCDSENNTQADLEAGRLNIAVGLNPVRPAEFVVFTISLFNGVITFSE